MWGHAPPGKFLEIRCSEIVSDDVRGQKQSRSSYMARGSSISSNFWLSMHAFPKAADFKFPREKALNFGRTTGGVASLEGQLSSAWTSNLFTHVFTHVFTLVLSSQRRKQLTRAFCAGPPWTNSHTVAATRLVWTAVILNGSETSVPLSNGRTFEMYS